LDNTPLEQAEADPDATRNYRTPRYDLDSVYGKGPVAEPQYYDRTYALDEFTASGSL
jgi:hypothetical protein